MSDLSRSVPTATHLLAESVRRYRAGFPGVARAFLPVFAVFAVGQIALALAGAPSDFGGYVLRALALAGIGLAELVLQFLAMCGLAASRENLARASVGDIYRAGARIFWPALWAVGLAGLALSAAPIAALLVSPYLTSAIAAGAAAYFGGSFEVVVTAAIASVALCAAVAVAASAALFEKLVFAFPLVAGGNWRGLAALERSAGLSEGRSWVVGARLAAGLGVTVAVIAPFAILVAASAGASDVTAPWAWGLFSAGYLLVALPFLVIFLAELSGALSDTAIERAVARERRPWIRGFVWAGLAALVLVLIGGIIG